MNEPIDYAEENAEEAVLTRWERLKKWFEIVMATKKLAMFVWALIFGVTGTMAVGKVTETNPLRDAAIEVGLVEANPIDTTSGMLSEEIMLQLADIQQRINQMDRHQHNYPDPVPLAPHKHADHIHKDHEHPVQKHTHPTEGVEEALKKLLPDNHKALH